MNIVVLGGGKPGKFGNDFVNKARQEGHRVIVLSHKDYATGVNDDMIISYHNLDATKEVLAKVAIEMPSIDIMLFNQNGGGYPDSVEDLFSEPNTQYYANTLQAHVVMPHLLVACLYANLKEGSKVVFMSSTMAFEYQREHYLSGVGYPSGKSFATHLMSSMARSRTKPVTFSAICPFFIYNDRNLYTQAFENLYKHIFEHDDNSNGKIVAQVKGFNNPPVEIKVKHV